jgi:hypothetical protein
MPEPPEIVQVQNDVASVRINVARLIAASTPDVVEAVIQSFVKTEKDRRAKVLVDGLNKHADAATALAKLKPDHMVFDNDGSMISQGWTANQKGAKDKAQKVVDKFTTALNAAISSGEFKLLEDALKGGGNKDADASQ